MELNHLGLPETSPIPNTPAQEKLHKLEQEKFLANVPKMERQSVAEAAIQRREENSNSVKGYKFKHQKELTAERPGRIMHHAEFIRRLKAISPGAFLNDFSGAGRVGVNVMADGVPTYVTTVQFGFGPEYSTIREDDHGLPTKERYRGWRTALLHLIMAGYVKEEDANREFGEATGSQSVSYNETLWQWRNHKEFN